MATYAELLTLSADQPLRDKITVAVVIAAEKIASETAPFGTPTTEQKAWARTALDNPRGEAKTAHFAVLAANASLSVAQIQAASDSAVQANVNAIVPTLAGG